MSEMVARVARAMHRDNRVPTSFDDCPDYEKIHYYDLARAAIAAMREPTKAMVSAAYLDATSPEDVYNVMIDAALR